MVGITRRAVTSDAAGVRTCVIGLRQYPSVHFRTGIGVTVKIIVGLTVEPDVAYGRVTLYLTIEDVPLKGTIQMFNMMLPVTIGSAFKYLMTLRVRV